MKFITYSNNLREVKGRNEPTFDIGSQVDFRAGRTEINLARRLVNHTTLSFQQPHTQTWYYRKKIQIGTATIYIELCWIGGRTKQGEEWRQYVQGRRDRRDWKATTDLPYLSSWWFTETKYTEMRVWKIQLARSWRAFIFFLYKKRKLQAGELLSRN